jgi:hypothetical protein
MEAGFKRDARVGVVELVYAAGRRRRGQNNSLFFFNF